MKYYLIISVLCMLLLVQAAMGTNINEKLIETFNRFYPKAKDIIWVEENSDYMVHFTDQSIKYLVYFDKKGNLIESTRYYTAADLPLKILWSVRQQFKDYDIYGVAEISNNTDTRYFIRLENEKQWRTVASDESGNLEKMESMNKQ